MTETPEQNRGCKVGDSYDITLSIFCCVQRSCFRCCLWFDNHLSDISHARYFSVGGVVLFGQ